MLKHIHTIAYIVLMGTTLAQSNQKGVFRTDTSKTEHIIDFELGMANNIGYNFIYNFNPKLSAGARFGFLYLSPRDDIPNGYEKHGISTTYRLFGNARIWRSIYFELHATQHLGIRWPTKNNLYDEGVVFGSWNLAITSGVRCMFFEHIMLRFFYGARFNYISKYWNFHPNFSIGYKF